MREILLFAFANGNSRFSRHFSRKDVTAYDGSREYVKTYLDDLLVSSKSTFLDHLVRPVLIRLREAGLKINAAKSKFCALETEYLGYKLLREGISPHTKK